MDVEGLTTLPSARSVKDTIDRLEVDVKSKGMTVFARVDHAAGAKEVGMALRPTELLIFGNARGGTPLMQAYQTMGIDLPLKALAFEDAEGKLSCPITSRHGWSRVMVRRADLPEVSARLAAVLRAVSKTAAAG